MAIHGVTVAGNPGPIQIREEASKTNNGLYENHYHYRGERIATASYYNRIRGTRITSARYQQDGASATVDVSSIEQSSFIDTIELDFNAVQREWWTCPLYAALSDTDRAKLIGALRQFERYSSEDHTPSEIADFFAELQDDFPDPFGDYLSDIFLNGETYTALLPVLTFTRVISKYRSDLPFIILDIGKIFLTGTMQSLVPASLQFTIDEVTNTVAANSKQTLAWLKTGRVAESSDGTMHLIQQYIFDAYATNRYTLA